jgi:hypothetical protein
MPKKISFGLSVSEVENAIKELRQYKSEITYKCQRFAERLAEEGVYIARVKIAEHNAIYTSELLDSIHHEYGGMIEYGGKWIIYTNCDYAPYVEFGTGIVAKQSGQHPLASLMNWKYDTNDRGEAGWHYFNEKDGQWHWTNGIQSRPFMFETGQDMRKIIPKIAKEIFNE